MPMLDRRQADESSEWVGRVEDEVGHRSAVDGSEAEIRAEFDECVGHGQVAASDSPHEGCHTGLGRASVGLEPVVGEPSDHVDVSVVCCEDDLEEIYTMRILMEGFAISRTVTSLTADDLDELADVYERMTAAAHAQDYDVWAGPHRRFHQLLVGRAGDRLAETAERLSAHAERYRYAYTTQVPLGWANGLREHEAVYTATLARDADSARGALCRHYARVALSSIALIDACHDPVHFRAALQTMGVEREP